MTIRQHSEPMMNHAVQRRTFLSKLGRGTVIGMGLGIPSFGIYMSRRNRSSMDVASLNLDQRRTWKCIENHLARAQTADGRAIEKGISVLDTFFKGAADRAPGFAAEVLSFTGKWNYMTSSKKEYQQYLNSLFERHLFSGSQLEQSVGEAVACCIAQLSANENILLVQLQADLKKLSSYHPPAFESRGVLKQSFASEMKAVQSDVGTDLLCDLATLTSSLVIGEIAVAIAARVITTISTRLATSGGILAAGAMSSGVTFGAGLVAAIVLDMAVDWTIGLFYDPVENVAVQLRKSLHAMAGLLIEGDQQAPGLRHELLQMVSQHRVVRRKALWNLAIYS